MLQEKLVAFASKKLIIIADDRKDGSLLGSKVSLFNIFFIKKNMD
jgi:ribose 5-phosphate isomerase